jgi:hypothetical protein
MSMTAMKDKPIIVDIISSEDSLSSSSDEDRSDDDKIKSKDGNKQVQEDTVNENKD